MAKNYVCLYHSYLDAIQALGDAERGRLLTAMLEYSITGAVGHLSGNERFLFPMIKAQIDRDQEKYEKKCRASAENGTKGGRPAKPSKSQKTQWVSEKPNKSQKSQGKGEGEGDKETTPPDGGVSKKGPARGPFHPPTLAEVEAYRAEIGSPVAPQEFIDFYASKGWMVGKNPMRDWKAAFRNAARWDCYQKPAPRGAGKSRAPTPGEDYAPTAERIQHSGDWLDRFLAGQEDRGDDG